MGLLNNMKTFKNWYCLYLTRYGLLHNEFILETMARRKIIVRPWTEDVRIVKSIFSKKNYMNKFVSISPNSVVVDVGANIGAFTIFASQWAKKILSFEPASDNFRMLCANIKLNDIRIATPYQMAITSEKGKRDFYVAEREHSGSHSFLLQRYDKAIEVETLSVADLIENESLKRINFLKLDCEGSEIEIIEGLSLKTAKKIEQIAMEFHYRNDYSQEDMVRRLKMLSFSVRLGERGGYIYARREL